MSKQRMSEFLTAVKSVRTQQNGDESLLTAVGSKNLRGSPGKEAETQDGNGQKPELRPSAETAVEELSSIATKPRRDGQSKAQHTGPAESPAEALQVLRSQPDYHRLSTILNQLCKNGFATTFSLDAPGPLQAQIISTLLTEIVPTFWRTLKSDDGDLMISCLKNVAGLSAVTARLRLLASQKDAMESIHDPLDIVDRLFTGDDLVWSIWSRICKSTSDQGQRTMLWKETVNLIGSGKVIAAVAQAEDSTSRKSNSGTNQTMWLANGSEYCSWLGRNVACMAFSSSKAERDIRVSDAGQLLAKGLHLGHTGNVFRGLFTSKSSQPAASSCGEDVTALVRALPAHAKRTFNEHLLRWLSTIAPDRDPQGSRETERSTASIAALLSTIVGHETGMLQYFLTHLKDPALSTSSSLPVRRACILLIENNAEEDALQQLLEKLVSTFSSTIFIAHAPVAQQECLAQTILITAGYVHQKEPMSLLMTARSSGHMQGVSNRLDSSNARARWLGMVVGTALSKLVDKPGSQMDFGTDEMKTAEAAWYESLVNVHDEVGKLEDFDQLLSSYEKSQKASRKPSQPKKVSERPAKINGKPVFGPPRPPRPAQTDIIGERVTEVLDDDGSDEDQGLKPYAKPDSDPEDSDEDATLVNRNKHRAPVYIRDLMAGLRDDQTYDRFTLAIKTAAPLIRRKAGFGKEVTDHAEELAGMLCNLQDPFDTDDFDDLRLQALVAVLLSDVKVIGPLLSRQAFAEGYSIAQRCVILSALGLGGRELAGFKIEDEDYNPKQSNTDFPSKRLPPRLHAIYSPTSTSTSNAHGQPGRLEAASKKLEHRIIQPLALQAADQSTAHLNAVKVRTFSSRMDVEKARTKRKPPANDLAKCFGTTFFFPLANRYQQEIGAYGSGSIFCSAPFVLVTFVKTLALLLHASGPATLGLAQISAEFWDLLLSLRVQAVGDISILQAVLFALLTLLEVNTDKQRIAQEHPKQLMETQQWVDLVSERMGTSGLVDEAGEGKSEEAKVRTLAAGVLMKCRDIVEAYQKQLVGYDFT